MNYKERMKKELKKKLSEKELELLPRGFQQIGHVIILNLKKELIEKKKLICEKTLELEERTKTCCIKTGEIIGRFRKPQIEFVAGEKKFEIEHKEYGCKFKFDVRKIMWAKGNIKERGRLFKEVKEGETIMDFFAGIGYWVIPILKHSKPKKIIAFEWNKEASHYLKENIKLNKLKQEKIKIIEGDSSKEAMNYGKADRIIMGLIPAPFFALPTALKCIKPKGIIHFEGTGNNEQELMKKIKEITKKEKKKIKLIKLNKVKSFKPREWHYTLDLQVN